MNRQIFRNINIDLKPDNVYRHLGFWNDTTVISQKQRNDIDSMMYDSLEFLNFSAVTVRQAIVGRGEDFLRLAGGVTFRSKDLAKVFSAADELLLMGATAGPMIMDKIYEMSDNDLTKATVFNAVAGEMVDDVFDWLMAYCRRSLRRDVYSVTRNRYSAGYGDFSLEYQKDMFDILKLNELGVSITSSFMLKPEKSVTAIAGILQK